MRRFLHINLIVMLLVLAISGTLLADQGLEAVEGEELDDALGEELEETMEIEEIPDDLLAELIDFVIERDPVYERQQEIMNFLIGEGETDLDPEQFDAEADELEDELPGYLEGSLREAELERMERILEAEEGLSQARRELVTEFMATLAEIFSYRHEVNNLEELYDLMLVREETVRRQVDAGLIEPEVLQSLTREIIEIRTSIADAELGMQFLRRELAFNFGGEDWSELLKMIHEFEQQIYD